MITFLTGVPGSGKTAYAVKKIIDFHDKKDKKNGDHVYSKIYNNIAGFKHDRLERSYKYPDDDFMLFAKTLHEKYLSFKKLDEVDDLLIDYVKEMGYFKSLIVIDEVHNIFPESEKTWVWLLSYHRHLYLDFIFITQSMSMIPNAKLKNMAENFVKALQSGKRIFGNSFRYNYYENSAMHNNKKYKTETIKMTSDIFDYYKSGDKVKQKSIVRVFILLGLFLVVITSILISVGWDKVFTPKNKDVHVSNKSISDPKVHIINNKKYNEIIDINTSVKTNDKNITTYDFEMNLEDGGYLDNYSCMMESCNFTDYYQVPKKLVSFLIDTKMINVISFENYDYDRLVTYAFISSSAAKLLSKYKIIIDDKKKKNDDDKKDSDFKVDFIK